MNDKSIRDDGNCGFTGRQGKTINIFNNDIGAIINYRVREGRNHVDDSVLR